MDTIIYAVVGVVVTLFVVTGIGALIYVKSGEYDVDNRLNQFKSE